MQPRCCHGHIFAEVERGFRSQMALVRSSAKQAKSPENIIIKVATDEMTYTREVPYNRSSLMQAGGRILLWVTPEKVEEGTHLKIDSLVLKTGDADFKGKTFPPPVATKKSPSRKKR